MDFPSAMSLVLAGTPVRKRNSRLITYLSVGQNLPVPVRSIMELDTATMSVGVFIPTQSDILSDAWEVSEWKPS